MKVISSIVRACDKLTNLNLSRFIDKYFHDQ